MAQEFIPRARTAHRVFRHAGAYVIALAVALGVAAGSAVGQTSTSGALIRANTSGSSTACGPSPVTGTATTFIACPLTAVAGGVGASSAASDNSARSATASATLSSGPSGATASLADAASWQYSALTVAGTPSPGDQLLFHFLTSQSAFASGGSSQGSAYWYLGLFTSSSSASVNQLVSGDGTQRGVAFTNATQTSSGFDLSLPFVPSSGTLSYFFEVVAEAGFGGPVPAGQSLSASVSATLQGIDAQTANGMFISSAVLDPRTGLGTISATPVTLTTPEPSLIALVATGLAGLVPVMRRRKS